MFGEARQKLDETSVDLKQVYAQVLHFEIVAHFPFYNV